MASLKRVIKIEYLFVLFLLISSVYLRFENLGYSDYIGDEHKAFIQTEGNQTTWYFFMTRRKGPMQFLVSYIPYSITGDYRNELAQRIPFAVISVFSVLVFYALVTKLTQDKYIGLISAFLMSICGFIVGFGRIAQYQNLNLLFSFLALYFYADLLYKKDKLILSSCLGTLFFSLSVLSHWDAVFILPVIIYIFAKSFNFKLVFINFILGCALLLPFLVPYISYQIGHQDNIRYFERRVDSSEEGLLNLESLKSKIERYALLFHLYNPFVLLEFLLIGAVLGLLYVRKNLPFVLWFLFSFIIFCLFVQKPGTHIYNFILPIIVISSIGIVKTLEYLPRVIKPVVGITLLLLLTFLYFQTYIVFIDHTKEYPWEQKEVYIFDKIPFIYKQIRKLPKTKPPRQGHVAVYKWYEHEYWETPKYIYDQKLPLFGFPHRRYWNEINEYVKTQNILNNEDFGYSTNELKTISEWYMEEVYKTDGDFYYIGIKRPLSFVNDYKPQQVKNKVLVHEIRNNGVNIVKIYKVQE